MNGFRAVCGRLASLRFASTRHRRNSHPASPKWHEPPPASLLLRQPTPHGRARRQALPVLAGQTSPFVTTPRRAPFSDNGEWWIAEIFISRKSTALCHHCHYRKRPSPLRCAGGGCAACWGRCHGGDGCALCLWSVARRRCGSEASPIRSRRGVVVGSWRCKHPHITPPTLGPPPWRVASLRQRLQAPRKIGGVSRARVE